MPQIRVFQIFYDEKTRSMLDPGFEPFDNTTNERPDWHEYWCIRRLFLAETFADDDYVGVLSPKFREKTGLDSDYVKRCVSEAEHEVCSFSPFFDQMSLYRSSFEQGERYHPGIVEATNRFLADVGLGVDVRRFAHASNRCIFSNYFVARKSFWTRWLGLAGKLYDACEGGSRMSENMNSATIHNGRLDKQLKVFVMERLVSVILDRSKTDASFHGKPESAPCADRSFSRMLPQLKECDRLKYLYSVSSEVDYLRQFVELRDSLLKWRRCAL